MNPPTRKLVAHSFALILVSMTLAGAGCLGGFDPTPISDPIFGQLEGLSHMVHEIPMNFRWNYTQTAREMQWNQEYRPGEFLIDEQYDYLNLTRHISMDITIRDDPNQTSEIERPILETITKAQAEIEARTSTPSFQAGQLFGAGSNANLIYQDTRESNRGNPMSVGWDDIITDPYKSGDSLYLTEPRGLGDGVGRVIPEIIGLAQKEVAGWFQPVPIIFRVALVIKNPVDDTILYGPTEIDIPLVFNVPFEVDQEPGQAITDSYSDDFTLRLITPFGRIGQFFYNVGIQGTHQELNQSLIFFNRELIPGADSFTSWTDVILVGLFILCAPAIFTAVSLTSASYNKHVQETIHGVFALGFNAGITAFLPDDLEGLYDGFEYGRSMVDRGEKEWIFEGTGV